MATFSEEGSLQPCPDPHATMTTVLKTLVQANAAQRTELDWQAQNIVRYARIPLPIVMRPSFEVWLENLDQLHSYCVPCMRQDILHMVGYDVVIS